MIFPIYAVALVVAVLAVAGLRVEEKKSEHHAATLGSCLALLSNGYVLMMVAAIFFYVGAEVSVSAGIPLYLKERFDIDINKVGLLGTGLFFTALTIGRFSGGVILNWIAPRKFFLITCAVSVVALAGLVRAGSDAGGIQLLRGRAWALPISSRWSSPSRWKPCRSIPMSYRA